MKNALSSVRSRKKITRLFPRRTLPDVLFLFSHHTLITFVVFRSFAHSSPEKHPPWRCRCNLSLRRYLLDVALPGISLISFSKKLHNSTLNTASHNVATAVIANLGSCYRLFYHIVILLWGVMLVLVYSHVINMFLVVIFIVMLIFIAMLLYFCCLLLTVLDSVVLR